MTQKFIKTNFPASTVDTEAEPEFHYSGGELVLRFKDYLRNDVQIRFPNVIGIKWTEEDDSGQNLRDDYVYEVHDSDWIKNYQTLGVITENDHEYRHLKIGFNVVGSFLEVIFKGCEQLET